MKPTTAPWSRKMQCRVLARSLQQTTWIKIQNRCSGPTEELRPAHRGKRTIFALRVLLPDPADWGHSDGLIFNQWNVGHGSRVMRIATAIVAGAVLLLSGLTAWALESERKNRLKTVGRRSVVEDRRFLRHQQLASRRREMRAFGGRQDSHFVLEGRRDYRRSAGEDGCRRPFLYLFDRQQPLAGCQLHVDHRRCSRWRGLRNDMGRQI